MTDVNLYSNTVTPANPATPPNGWVLTTGSSGGIQVGASLGSFYDADNAYSGWSSLATPSRTGDIIKCRVYSGASSNFDSAYFAATLIDSSGAGYMFEVQPFAFKLFKFAAGQIAGTRTQVGTASSAARAIVTDYFDIDLNVSTGALKGYKNGTQVVSATDTTYVSNILKCGFAQKGYTNQSGISRVTAFDVQVYGVTSINGGNPITYGQTGIASALTGFPAPITSITATYASGTKSVACTVTGGTTNNPVFTIADRADGSTWPTDGTTLTFTFSDGTNTAAGTQLFGKKAGEVKAPTWAGAVTSDLAYFSANLYADNFEVEGGEFIVKSPNLMGGSIGTLSADGGNGGTDAGVYDTWFIPASDKSGYTGRAGKAYFYRWTIGGGGEIISVSKFIGSTIKGSLLAGSILKGKLL